MEALIGIGAVVFVILLFGGLHRLEAGRRRRMVRDVTRPTLRYDLVGDLLPSEDVSLGPVDYRRIPAAEPVGYVMQTQQARHAPTLESSFMVPALTALGTCAACTVGAMGLAIAFGWSLRVVAATFAVSLVGSWFWRLGFADRVLWSVESWSGRDLNNDHNIGNPALGFAVVNPGAARRSVAQQSALDDTAARQQALLEFTDKCYLSGCSESAHGVQATGPARANFVACRDVLFSLGLARWKSPGSPKAGWTLTTDPATAKSILASHVA